MLARAAHRGQRTGLGVGESQVGDDLVPSWWRRAIAEQDAGESLARALAVAVIVMAAAVTVGPGVASGYGGYRLLARYAPRIGRLWVWPWLTGGASAGLLLWLFGLLTGPRLTLVPRLPVLWTSLTSNQLVISWVCWQAVIALVAVGYYVWAWGWRAVPRGAVTPSKQLADGTWRETPEAEKVDIGFRADDYDPYVPPAVEDDDGYQWPEESADDEEFLKGEKS